MPKRSKNNQPQTLFNPKGAGRPSLKDKKLKWIRRNGRSSLPARTPVHVTLKLKVGIVTSLRTKKIFKQFKLALIRARIKGLRIVHFSLQKDHIHLFIEASNQAQLSRGMQSFAVSLALSLKKLSKAAVQGIFKDRYHIHILRTPQEVKNTIRYIIGNGFKHKVVPTLADCYSSAVTLSKATISDRGHKLDFLAYFKTRGELRAFKLQMHELIDKAQFWLSKQITSAKDLS